MAAAVGHRTYLRSYPTPLELHNASQLQTALSFFTEKRLIRAFSLVAGIPRTRLNERPTGLNGHLSITCIWISIIYRRLYVLFLSIILYGPFEKRSTFMLKGADKNDP